MPTIYLKDATFSKLVDSGHYHDHEKVIARGVDLALMEEKEFPLKHQQPEVREELPQLPKPTAGSLPIQAGES